MVRPTGGADLQGPSSCGNLPRRHVDPEFVAGLREHGMPAPARSLQDPHLEFPEFLLTGGWDRETISDGYAYRFVAQEEDADGRAWQQYYECHEDGSRLLFTQAGDREQTITRDSEGHVRCTFRYATK